MGFFFSIGVIIGGLIVFYMLLALAAYSSELANLINSSVIAVLKDVVGPVSAGFGGAIAGAYSAYLLQQKNEENKERRADYSVARRTAIQLTEKLNELLSIKKYNIHPCRENKIRFLAIPKLPVIQGVSDRVDVRILDVLLSVGAVEAIDTIVLADMRYRACFENFANRNISLDEYRAILQKSTHGFEDELSLREIASIVEPGRLVALNEMTEQMLEVLDETLISLKDAVGMISAALDSKFKGSREKTIKIDLSGSVEYLEKMPKPHFDSVKLQELLRHYRNA